jgi:hypothetical protein
VTTCFLRKKFIGLVEETSPNSGAKPSYLISSDHWKNADWLCALIGITSTELPKPKPKKKKLTD